MITPAVDLVGVGLIVAATVVVALFLLVPGTPFPSLARRVAHRMPAELGDIGSDPDAPSRGPDNSA